MEVWPCIASLGELQLGSGATMLPPGLVIASLSYSSARVDCCMHDWHDMPTDLWSWGLLCAKMATTQLPHVQ
jgi:hypothetical protein